MRLRWQVATTMAALAAAATSTASWAAYRSTQTQLQTETDHFLQDRLEALTALSDLSDFSSFSIEDFSSFDYSSFGSSDTGFSFGPFGMNSDSPFGSGSHFSFTGPGFLFAQPDANTTYLDSDGNPKATLSTTDLEVTDEDRYVASTATAAISRDVTWDGRDYRVLTAPLTPGDTSKGAVQLSRDVTESRNLLGRLRWRLAAITASVTVAAAAIGWAIARQLAKPLEQLRNAAVSVAETKTFDTRLDPGAKGEVGEVTRSFNSMLAELDESRRRQHQLMQDANHELRTPLASLSANLELLERIPADDPERDEILGEARAELVELTDLADQLTAAASIQYNPATRTSISLCDVARAALGQFNKTSARSIKCTVESALTVEGAPDVLGRAVFNLLTNADKHTPADASISLVAVGSTIIVSDSGPGIPDVDLPHIFEPFYRSAASRTLPGSGLGLSLVKQIVEDHSGTVKATNDPRGGAIFTITLPTAASE